jgi:hypothetical protein
MYNMFTGCLNQLCSAIGVKVPNFEPLQLLGGSQINPITGYLTGPNNTIVHIDSPIGALHKQSLASSPNQAGDPPSLAPQIEVQATIEAHTEPLRASPLTKISELANASITIVEQNQSSPLAHAAVDHYTTVHIESPTVMPHKQSLASGPDVAVNRPSSPNQVEGVDTTACDGIGAHIEASRPSLTIAVAKTEPTNATINRPESILGSDTTTLVQQIGKFTIRLGNHVTEHDEKTADSKAEILTEEIDDEIEVNLNKYTVVPLMPTLSSSAHPSK